MIDNHVINGSVKRSFDLNIEKILENWEVYHAIREIISNALDEQVLSNSKNINICKQGEVWHIKDFGRGLSYFHLTQNENEEKMRNDKLIGRFGVGLKDALATLYRHGIIIQISSKYGVITLDETSKEGFEDIITLHAEISPPYDENMIGTDFILIGCSDDDIFKAKSLFLLFTENDVLETTQYGQVIRKKDENGNIYINGVKVAEEANFLFSYNITALNKQIKKALNRERTNIGRSAYSDRVKSILLACNESCVINTLTDDLQEFSSGNRHDELQWTEVELYASRKLSSLTENVTFITPDEIKEVPSIVDEMNREGYSPIIISKKLGDRIESFNEEADEEEILTTTTQYISKQKEKFCPKFIEREELAEDELMLYDKTTDILSLIGGCPKQVLEIKIAEDIYLEEIYSETVGLWQASDKRIIIKRKQLSSLENYAGTLLHECAHAVSGADDVSRDFELQLTTFIGKVVKEYLKGTNCIDKKNLNYSSNDNNENLSLDDSISELRKRINNILK